ncbi:NAD(P)/FAD-dependent oxidoreductase [Rubritalea spongiae]|uniref:NAD(P)/FAD-dependent oxidoreductase n=1 Tax=Rubritalea spongiae TaxID=430797 RepID=A0ABW5DZV9_9BACT
MSSHTDVLIQGAGPAGLFAASWLAREGHSVLIQERPRASPLQRIEALGPDVLYYLRQIGLDRSWLSKVAQPVPGTISRWSTEEEEYSDAMLNPHGHAWSTRRDHFDSALRNHAQILGVQFTKEARQADIILTATGSETAKKAIITDKLIAFTRNYHCQNVLDLRLRIEATPHGWWYAQPAPGGIIGLGFLTDRETIKGLNKEHVWQEMLPPSLVSILMSAQMQSPIHATSVTCALVSHSHHHIGNARASYDPLTGRGVAEALRNTLETISSLPHESGSKPTEIEQHYNAYLTERRQLYTLGFKRFKSDFWQRRITTPSSLVRSY